MHNDLFALICDRYPDGILVAQGNCLVYANPALVSMAGGAAEALQRYPLHALWADGWEAVAQEDAFETRFKGTGDRPPLDVSVLRHRLQSGGQSYEVLIVRDIAERKRIAQELLKSRQLESIAALSGGIAHDYNNLLTAIMGNISLALSSIEPASPLAAWLDQAQEAALIAKELTNRLITFSKGGTPQMETVRIAELIQSAAEFALSGSNIDVGFEIDDDLWSVDVDRMQIAQALHNIVINAREAMPDGGHLYVNGYNRIFPASGAQGGGRREVVIAVQDTGVGIAPEQQSRIFDPYFSTKEMGAQKGMGLGLSIANSIIKSHNGTIQLASSPGEGARFEICLPASEATRIAVDLVPAQVPCPVRCATGRILVMDDEEMIRTLAASILTKLGYEPALAANGEQAITAYEAAVTEGRPFDAVILDLTVKGGLGGKETVRRLQEIDPQVVGIVSSGYANDPGVTSYRDFGFSGVVAKPYRLEELRAQLCEVLGCPPDAEAPCHR
jgi:two-component system cell cycle sensor histidine kinase/response regulator CckA